MEEVGGGGGGEQGMVETAVVRPSTLWVSLWVLL